MSTAESRARVLRQSRRQHGSVHVVAGPLGRRLLTGYRRAAAALVRSGNNVVVAECKFDPDGWDDWKEALKGLAPVWVAVRCSLEECERRERHRGDRLIGLADGHFERAHFGAKYDLEVDLTDSQIDEATGSILQFVTRGPDAKG